MVQEYLNRFPAPHYLIVEVSNIVAYILMKKFISDSSSDQVQVLTHHSTLE